MKIFTRVGLFFFFSFFYLSQIVVPASAQAAPQEMVVATQSAESTVVINFFYSQTCTHCARAASFIQNLAEKYPQARLHAFEVSNNQDNALLLRAVGQKLNIQVGGVPLILIGTQDTTGYQDDTTTGQYLEATVVSCLENWQPDCEDQVAEFLSPGAIATESGGETPGSANKDSQDQVANKTDATVTSDNSSQQLNLPLIGAVDLKSLSLPVLTLVVALLDGFNPCAMWTLVFLITLLLGMKDRKRMWILGITFIFVSSLVYFLFLAAWLNLFLFLGLLTWVRLVIALVALGAGGYSLYDYVANQEAACKVTHPKQRQQVFARLKKIVKQQQLWLALVGISLLAVVVNIVELFCSAGLPAIYTQILSLTSLTRWQYYLYLLFYIFIFMLDDLLVFAAAMVTLKMTGIESKYARFSRLIGGILMLIIGALLIFRPAWLAFG